MLYQRINEIAGRIESRTGAIGFTILVSIVLLIAAALYVRPELYYVGAGMYFERLANNPFDFSQNNPFAFRILTPLISYIVGLRGKLFMVTNGIITLLFIGFIYRHFRVLSGRAGDALCAAAVITFSSTVLVTIAYSGFCDILSYLGIFAMWHWRKHFVLFSLFFAVALFNHENVLFLVPWLITIRMRDESQKMWSFITTVLGLGIVLIGFHFFRDWVTAERQITLSLSYYIEPLLADPFHWMRQPIQYYGLGLFTVFKAFWLIPIAVAILLWKERRKFDIIVLILPVVLASIQLIIAIDSTRMFTLGFMTMILAIEYLLRENKLELLQWLPALILVNLFVPQLYTASNVIENVRSTPMHLLRMWLENKPWWP